MSKLRPVFGMVGALVFTGLVDGQLAIAWDLQNRSDSLVLPTITPRGHGHVYGALKYLVSCLAGNGWHNRQDNQKYAVVYWSETTGRVASLRMLAERQVVSRDSNSFQTQVLPQFRSQFETAVQGICAQLTGGPDLDQARARMAVNDAISRPIVTRLNAIAPLSNGVSWNATTQKIGSSGRHRCGTAFQLSSDNWVRPEQRAKIETMINAVCGSLR